MATAIYTCMVKGITSDKYEFIGRSPEWITARRGLLKIFDDHLECGDWIIQNTEIESAALKTRRFLFLGGHILMIKTAKTVFQFGVNANPFWASGLPFPVTRD